MDTKLREILLELNLFRDWVEHLSLCLSPEGVQTYKSDIINQIDKLISSIANPSQGILKTTQDVDNKVDDFTPEQLWVMAQKLNMDDFVQIVKELQNLK